MACGESATQTDRIAPCTVGLWKSESPSSPQLDVPPEPPPPPPRASSGTQVEPCLSSRLHSGQCPAPGRPSTAPLLQAEHPTSAHSIPLHLNVNGKRTLLLVYIHGFLGDETTFQSFPAHVHNLVSILIKESHVIHTKIYPRYRSRRALEFATHDFSTWLAPHELPNTDIILLGHSMGGLLAAEAVLLPSQTPTSGQMFRHRIIGTINFDTPFLGIHPRVIKSGLGSLFRPDPSSPEMGSNRTSSSASSYFDQPPSESQIQPASSPKHLGSAPPTRTNTLFSSHPTDPNYNPSYSNDIILPLRKGWDGFLYFVNKHSGDLAHALKNYIQSHLEFGQAMADPRALKRRYNWIRSLEEDDESTRIALAKTLVSPPRVRFVNYYTKCTGRLKRVKARSIAGRLPLTGETSCATNRVDSNRSGVSPNEDQSGRPQILVDGHCNGYASSKTSGASWPYFQGAEEPSELGKESYHWIVTDPRPVSPEPASDASNQRPSAQPQLPDSLPGSDSIIPSQLFDGASRKLTEHTYTHALKEHKRATKECVAAGSSTISPSVSPSFRPQYRSPPPSLVPLPQAHNGPQTDSQEKTVQPPRPPGFECLEAPIANASVGFDPENDSDSETGSSFGGWEAPPAGSTPSATSSLYPPAGSRQKRKHPKTFCLLPRKNPAAGEPDPAWIGVHLEDVDEVGAHCGLFSLGESYAKLVGDVVERIEQWIKEDQSMRLADQIRNSLQ